MPANSALLAAVAQVDMMDLTGRIIANPARNAVQASTAEVLALALATEGLWSLALETELLMRALRLPITGNDGTDAARDAAVQEQSNLVNDMLAALRGRKPTQHTEETTHGNR